MDRLLLTLLMVAIFVLSAWAMWRGWRRKARRQRVELPQLPTRPDELGQPVLPAASGLYVSTTTAGQWHDRIVTGGMGLRSAATWRLYPQGLAVSRVGAPDVWIPAEFIVDVRRDRAIAGKVMGTDSLLVLTWLLGQHRLDTGFRGDDLGGYDQWISALRGTARAAQLAGNGANDRTGGVR